MNILKLVILMFLMAAALPVVIFADGAKLFPIYVDGKGGYIDAAGKVVIEPRFDQVRDFHDGLAGVALDWKWGLIDSTGNFKIKPSFDHVKSPSENRSLVWQDRKCGFIDITGNTIVPTIFEKCDSFSEGLARVRLSGKWQYIDTNGKIQLATDFEYAGDFHEGFAVVGKEFNDKDFRVSYIDRTGKLTAAGWLTYATPYSEGLAVISTDENMAPYLDGRSGALGFDNLGDLKNPRIKDVRFRVVDRSGSPVFEKTLHYVGEFSNGRIMGCFNGKCGYLDTKGNVAIDFRFDAAGDFAEGLANVKINEEVFMIDTSGKTIFKANGSLIRPFRNGLAPIFGSAGPEFNSVRYVNASGETIWQTNTKKDSKATLF